jgi:HEAT repeat protein
MFLHLLNYGPISFLSLRPMTRPFALFFGLLLWGCSTTEQQVEDLLEQLAANPIDSPAWQQAVDQLSAIGRPAARQLLAHLNPDHYLGEHYREFRGEIENLRTGSARALGRIKPRGATAALKDRITTAYTPAERLACVWAIGEIGFDQAGLDALKTQLKDQDPLIRLHAAIALVKMDDESGNALIDSALSSGQGELSAVALVGLEEANYFGVPLLVRLVQEPHFPRQRLGQVLKTIENRLLAQLEAEDPVLRQRAARALGQIGDPEAAPSLAALLEDPSNLVRFNAAAALASMEQEAGIDFLFAALRNPDPILRANAVRFLTQVQQNSSAVEAQLTASLKHQDPLARAGAAQVLGQALVSKAIPALLAALQDPLPEVRANAAIALGRLAAAETRQALRGLLDDGDPTVSYYAEWALARLGQG